MYYRGHYNIESQLDHMVKNHALDKYTEIILSGCSAGGMASRKRENLPTENLLEDADGLRRPP